MTANSFFELNTPCYLATYLLLCGFLGHIKVNPYQSTYASYEVS